MKEITKEDFDTRLGSKDNLVVKKDIFETSLDNKETPGGGQIKSLSINGKEVKGGRTNGSVAVPMEVRAIIGSLAQTNTAKELSKEFNVSEAAVNDYRNGLIGDVPSPELRSKIKGLDEKISDRAAELVLKSLGLIGDKSDEMADMKVRELANLGLTIASIKDKVSPKEVKESGGQVIIFAPQMSSIENYQTLEIRKTS